MIIKNIINVNSKRSENYKIISTDSNKPLFNRALQGTYPPGSTFKLLNSLISLQENIIKKSTSYSCYDGYKYENDKKVRCHTHKSPVNLTKGIEISCNTFFCNR